MTYRLEITYRCGGDPQVHSGLSPAQAESSANAFLRDLLLLDGEGVSTLTVKAEIPASDR